MYENAAITRIGFARSPRFFAPAELGDEFVIGVVRFASGEVAVILAADAQHAVGESEDVIGIIFPPKLFQIGIEIIEIFMVQKMNDFAIFVRRDAAAQERRNEAE